MTMTIDRAKKTKRSTHWRTAIVPARLAPADRRRAHETAHVYAEIWNNAVAWVRETRVDGFNPGVYEIKKYVLTLSSEERPVHTHTAQEVAFDLADAIKTYRENRNQGMKVKAPWRDRKSVV